MFTNDADFSDMLQQAVPLDISSVVQKAYIQVNEEGTTAAAATGSLLNDFTCGVFYL